MRTETPSVPNSAIEKVLRGEGTTRPFADTYRRSNNYPVKFAWANALIDDGRYGDFWPLLRDFVGPSAQVDDKVRHMEDDLRLKFVEKGLLPKNSEEERKAEDAVSRFVDRDEVLRQLKGLLPIHIMGAVTNAKLYEGITDEEKSRNCDLLPPGLYYGHT